MRFIFKTSYDQDIRLFKHGGQVFWYGLLGWCCSPRRWSPASTFCRSCTSSCIYSIVGFGLMLLIGFTGQISLGHAAFLAVGAYTEALLQARGVPFCRVAALRGAAVGGGRASWSGCRRCASRASTWRSPRSPST